MIYIPLVYNAVVHRQLIDNSEYNQVQCNDSHYILLCTLVYIVVRY